MPALTPLRRVGHKGADLIAPGNTPESFDAALAAGVDMIEFDVLPENWRDPRASRLLLAHDYEHDIRQASTLEEGLAHLASSSFDGIDLDLDLKLPGYEDRVVAALRTFGLVDRTLVSSHYRHSLDRVGLRESRLRLGWSVPRARRDYTQSALWALPAAAALAYMRGALPGQAARALRAGLIDAVMAHWKIVTRALVRHVRRAGGELYVWTVDDPEQIRTFEALGVTGVITNDPRLFLGRSGTTPGLVFLS